MKPARPHPRMVLLLAVVALIAIAYGLASRPGPGAPPGPAFAPAFTDVQLYRDQVALARSPATWYARVTDEQRRRG